MRTLSDRNIGRSAMGMGKVAALAFGVAMAAACQSNMGAPMSPSAVNPASLAAGPGGDGPQNDKVYKASISPASAAATTQVTFTVRITNCGVTDGCSVASGNSANLQSANVVVPAGFTNITNLAVSVSNGGTWDTPVLDGSTLKTDKGGGSDGLDPGAWVDITFRADVSCDAASHATFLTAAFQEPDNVTNPFTLSGSQPSVEVTKDACGTGDDCPAAPSIAAHYLHDHGVAPGSSEYNNIVAAVAHHMGPETDFDGIGACEDGYAEAVEAFTQNLIDTYVP